MTKGTSTLLFESQKLAEAQHAIEEDHRINAVEY
jgi:hypothetical protein